jgi:hypothetical protein
VKNGWLVTNDWKYFEINNPIIKTELLSTEELDRGKKEAYRKFYFRPTYMIGTLHRIKSPADLYRLLRQGISFLMEWVFSGDNKK